VRQHFTKLSQLPTMFGAVLCALRGKTTRLTSRPEGFHLRALPGRVEGWRAGVARGTPTHTTSPAPSTSHATCGFPALRAPICFTPKLMGPIQLGRLSARRVALDKR
jgi:hypothetical protein